MTTPIDGLDRLGSAVLFVVVAFPTMVFWMIFVGSLGIDRWLHGQAAAERMGIELVVLPFAALAAARLRWGVEAVDSPESRSLWLPLLGTAVVCTLMWTIVLRAAAFLVVPLVVIAAGLLQAPLGARVRQLERRPGIARHVAAPRPAARSSVGVINEPSENNAPWLPWVGAAVAFAVICYLAWSWLPPQTLVGPSQFGVVRWAGTALVAGVGYLGMIFFPRLTASLAGAVAGPALFGVVGYILVPSFMRGPERPLADILAIGSIVGVFLTVTAMPFLIAFSQRVRVHPLSYAVWTGALTFWSAVFGTVYRTYPFSS